VPYPGEARGRGSQTGNQKPHNLKNLPNQPTRLDTIEIEQSKQNATQAVAFSFWLTRRLAGIPKPGFSQAGVDSLYFMPSLAILF
jgi:hypothetical protein